ncbi:MAG TPA: DinB family protein [Candidatus Acidoferrales bacterium]|jgi:uncharacterized damage-inducible protein DinB|nr:DinB family protein [Candidatus Acidoferrales bacterium]
MASLIAHFQMLARYNSIANERLYDACGRLDEEEYRRERAASFRSVHRTLNHILLGDRIWMARFTETGYTTTPALGSELYPDFASLRAARVAEDARIEAFLADATEELLAKEVRYVNSAGEHHADPAGLLLAHLFNHQTHHRGQVHVMLSQTTVRPPALDMHRAIRPEAESRRQASG